MSDTTHQCTIFDEFNSTAEISNMPTITTLEDCRGDGCTCTIDRTVINNVLSDFSGDARYKLEVSEDYTHEGLILTLSDNCAPPPTKARIHKNRRGDCERDEEGWVWYSRGYYREGIKYI